MKSILIIIFIQAISGLFLYKFFPEVWDVIFAIVIVFLYVAEFARISLQRERSSGKIKNDLSQFEQEDSEYHNDFSKVPAGEKSSVPVKPLNLLAVDPYKEFNDALSEDLKNIGLEKNDGKEK